MEPAVVGMLGTMRKTMVLKTMMLNLRSKCRQQASTHEGPEEGTAASETPNMPHPLKVLLLGVHTHPCLKPSLFILALRKCSPIVISKT